MKPQANEDKLEIAQTCTKILAEEEAKVLKDIDRGFITNNDELINLYQKLGGANHFVDLEKAISYYERCKVLIDGRFGRGRDEDNARYMHTFNGLILFCFVDFGRYSEALDKFKQFRWDYLEYEQKQKEQQKQNPNSKQEESQNSNDADVTEAPGMKEELALFFAEKLLEAKQHSLLSDLLDFFSGEMESGIWTFQSQLRANDMRGTSVQQCGENHNAIKLGHKRLALAQKYKKKDEEARCLQLLGVLYKKSCHHRASVHHFKKGIALHEEGGIAGVDEQAKFLVHNYTKLGEVYLDRIANNSEKAHIAFQDAQSVEIKNAPIPRSMLAEAARGEGLAFYDDGDLVSAMECIVKSLRYDSNAVTSLYASCICVGLIRDPAPSTDATELGFYLKKADAYFNEYLVKSRLHSVNLCSNLTLLEKQALFCGAQIKFLQGDFDQARYMLERLFDSEIEGYKSNQVHCHSCGQCDGKSVTLLRCSGCKVKYYCNEKHQRAERRKRFLPHELLCPLLNRWRKAKKQMRKRPSPSSLSKASLDTVLRMALSFFATHFLLEERDCFSKVSSQKLQEILKNQKDT